MSNGVAVKICGITSAADANAAADAGADMLGFNFYEGSARFIEPRRAAAIIEHLRSRRAGMQCIGVFVDTQPERIRAIVDESGVDTVQLHGNEAPSDIRALSGLRVIKALRVHRDFDPGVVSNFPCDGILLDTWHPGQYGGTGERFEWGVAANVRHRVRQLILAGGLNAANVAGAIAQVQPHAVDVCSGIEDAPGRKNAGKLREFMDAVRRATAPAEVAS
jgi:phosphoribosylanthranilate isomerase